MTIVATETTALTTEQLSTAVTQLEFELETVRESYSMLELAREDIGYQRIGAEGQQKFSRQGLRDSAKLCRVMLVGNPLLKRGVELRIAYVWSQGVNIAARANGQSEDNPAEQDVNAVVQEFLTSADTQRTLTGASARARNERSLATDGTLTVALFTDALDGTVRPRVLPYDEIADVFYNPEDRLERRFVLRTFTQTVTEPGAAGGLRQRTETRRIIYPTIDYRPAVRPDTIGGIPVQWDAPVVEMNVNELEGWDFGIGDLYPAIPWARAYSEYLTNWLTLIKALSRFAFRATSDTRTKAQSVASKIQQTATMPVGLPGPNGSVGATGVMGPGQHLEQVPNTGAKIDAESGRPVASLIAAALGVPVTLLLSDPGVTGARATAETLDPASEDMATLRRSAHAEFLTRVLDYVIDASAKAPRGKLRRKSLTRDRATGREVVALAGDTDRTVEITWPDLTQTPLKDLMAAIATAHDTGVLPPVETLKQIMRALGYEDRVVDQVVDQMTDEDGNFIDPDTTAGDAAVRRFRNGDDPAAVA